MASFVGDDVVFGNEEICGTKQNDSIGSLSSSLRTLQIFLSVSWGVDQVVTHISSAQPLAFGTRKVLPKTIKRHENCEPKKIDNMMFL